MGVQGRNTRCVSCLLSVVSFGLVAWLNPSMARGEALPIGEFTAVQGNVFMARAGAERPLALQQYDVLQDHDVVQTELRSRAKVLLQDDTLVALGEESRLQIVEEAHDRTQDRRILILKLTQGRVRVLVGRKFNGPGSRVELRTPTGVVSAREGSFAAWIDTPSAVGDTSGVSAGVSNIGQTPINFSASGEMVTLISGQSSVAQPRRPPSQPELFRTALAAVNRAVQDTQVPDRLKPQSPREVLQASGGPEITAARTVTPAAPTHTQTPGKQPPLMPVTPPAVISGAASAEIGAPVAPSVPAPASPPTPTVAAPPAPAPPAPVVTAPPAPTLPSPPTVTLPIPTLPSVSTDNSGSGSRGGNRNRGRD